MKIPHLIVVALLMSTSACRGLNRLLGMDNEDSGSTHGTSSFSTFDGKVRAAVGFPYHKKDFTDEDVQTVIRWVVAVLLQPDGAALDKWRSEWLPVLPEYFGAFMQYPLVNRSGAFCQKSSLSASETLLALGVWSRQFHQRNNLTGLGDHQFMQYLCPNTNKWRLIDPFYGCYYEMNGEPMTAIKVKYFVENGGHAIDLMVKFDQSRNDISCDLNHLSWRWENEHLEDGLVFPRRIKEEIPWNEY